MLLSLSYVSTPARGMTLEDVTDLWVVSYERNDDADITGGLLYAETHFLQTLEGDEAAVYALMDTIRRDPRHRDVEIISENDITLRFYKDWPMRLIDASLSDYLRRRFARDRIADASLADTNKLIFELAHI